MNVVLDSSVITKWYFDEEQNEQAQHLRDLHKQNSLLINAPLLLLSELGNIFVNKKVTEINFFKESITTLLDLNVKLVETGNLLDEIFEISLKFKLSFYDATYVALAKSLKCNFVTADKKLVSATKTLKFVKLL